MLCVYISIGGEREDLKSQTQEKIPFLKTCRNVIPVQNNIQKMTIPFPASYRSSTKIILMKREQHLRTCHARASGKPPYAQIALRMAEIRLEIFSDGFLLTHRGDDGGPMIMTDTRMSG
jgi:hypothetical protein